jgi:hypothetical protein
MRSRLALCCALAGLALLLALQACAKLKAASEMTRLYASWPLKGLRLPPDAQLETLNPITSLGQSGASLVIDEASSLNNITGRVWAVGFDTQRSYEEEMADISAAMKSLDMCLIVDEPHSVEHGVGMGQRWFISRDRRIKVTANYTSLLPTAPGYDGWTIEVWKLDSPMPPPRYMRPIP